MALTSKEIEAGIARLDRKFMTTDVCYAVCAVPWDTQREGLVFDLDGIGGDVSREVNGGSFGEVFDGPTDCRGYFARLSASGYLDATEWRGPFKTLEEAQAYLVETFDDGADDSED